MSQTNPIQARPREKVVRFQDNFFRVNEVSFINGALQPPGTLVQLQVGIKAGANLTEVDQAGNEIGEGSEAPANAFLANNAVDVIASIPDADDETLAHALDDESAETGKRRKTVIEALEAEIARRKAA